MQNKKILVVGDVTIDKLQWKIRDDDNTESEGKLNWKLYSGFNMLTIEGGSLLLKNMIESNTECKSIIAQKIPDDKSNIMFSMSILDKYQLSTNEKEEVYRVKEFCGFSGPERGLEKKIPVTGDNKDVDIIVLDDAGDYFRYEKECWPLAIKEFDKEPFIVYKVSRPLFEGDLWEFIIRNYQKNLIIILDANDLREHGINISRRISWDRTCIDFVREIKNNEKLSQIKDKNIIIRFGIDGVILHQGVSNSTKLFFDPNLMEDGYIDEYKGKMQGYGNAFTAAIVASIYENNDLKNIEDGIKKGIISSRLLHKYGFGNTLTDKPEYPLDKIFDYESDKESNIENIKTFIIPKYFRENSTILESRINEYINKNINKEVKDECGLFSTESIACHFVLNGKTSLLGCVPLGVYGKLRTMDRFEIESYQNIKNLMNEYVKKDNQIRPLSIAVFGPPGSGKSFGVKQLAKSIDPEKIKEMTFNMAQFTSENDLTDALHRVRDEVLKGNIPLVFFDEFDCDFSGNKLGWLKFFLSPMQDCQFKQGESMHPIGKSIFVFAGGIHPNFNVFSREEFKTVISKDEIEEEMNIFHDSKGPDFVSRLRGYINILGPNWAGQDDNLYVIRRAVFLRSILERKAKNIFKNEKAQIDPSVLRAFLSVPKFKHGVRSLEAIVDMSVLEDRYKYEPSALPPKELLDIHVNSKHFQSIVLNNKYLDDMIDALAEQIHKDYLEDNIKDLKDDDPARKSWAKLNKSLKDTNRGQARDIINKLRSIGYDIVPGKNRYRFEFSEQEILYLAKKEHERWMNQKIAAGWIYGPKKIDANKTHPDILPWSNLPEKEQKKDIKAVSKIPKYLERAGFEIVSLKD